jgi:hypothetical protein
LNILKRYKVNVENLTGTLRIFSSLALLLSIKFTDSPLFIGQSRAGAESAKGAKRTRVLSFMSARSAVLSARGVWKEWNWDLGSGCEIKLMDLHTRNIWFYGWREGAGASTLNPLVNEKSRARATNLLKCKHACASWDGVRMQMDREKKKTSEWLKQKKVSNGKLLNSTFKKSRYAT